MTTEQKAKAYDEAVERARKIHSEIVNNELLGFPGQIEDIFPQLRESEDERIRKVIYTLILGMRKEIFTTQDEIVTKEKVLAYLEKQKENPKSADSIPSDCTTDAKCDDRWHKVADFLPDSGRDVLAKDALGNYLLASFDGDQWFVSVYDGEDKPIVYTPAIKEWCDIPSEKQKEQKPLTAEEYRKTSDELYKNHPWYMQKQEWSDEDVDMLNSCISSIEEAKENRYAYKETDGDTSYDHEIAWLKSLRPQPQGTYKQIVHSIYDILKDKDFFEIQPSHRVSLLNDIRVKCKIADECAEILDKPHWKPTEEQMDSLRDTIVQTKGYSYSMYLPELYVQLKKLKEE